MHKRLYSGASVHWRHVAGAGWETDSSGDNWYWPDSLTSHAGRTEPRTTLVEVITRCPCTADGN